MPFGYFHNVGYRAADLILIAIKRMLGSREPAGRATSFGSDWPPSPSPRASPASCDARGRIESSLFAERQRTSRPPMREAGAEKRTNDTNYRQRIPDRNSPSPVACRSYCTDRSPLCGADIFRWREIGRSENSSMIFPTATQFIFEKLDVSALCSNFRCEILKSVTSGNCPSTICSGDHTRGLFSLAALGCR
jgi:hypothetical protein